MQGILRESSKKFGYVRSFFKKKIIHTNLQILYDCNFRCSICDFWKKDFDIKSRLSAENVKIISEKLRTIGPQIVSIGGGEPLLHREIVQIVKNLSLYHFPVMICNGWYVEPKLAKRLFEAGMYEISVSVDYIDPKKHDAQRGREGAFERAIRALKILSESRVHPHQRVHMISVVMDDNLEDIEPLIKLCKDMGITYLVTLYSDNRGAKAIKQPDKKISEHLLELKKKYKEFVVLRGYVSRFSDAAANGGIGPCYAGKNLCNIDSNGNVSFCIDRLDTIVGNILEDDMHTIEQKLLEQHKENTCEGCWTSCRGSIEAVMYGGNMISNLLDYRKMTKPISIN